MARHFRSRAQFQALLRQRPVARTPHFALHRLPEQGLALPGAAAHALFAEHDGLWLDAIVPKRWARRAVRRNLLRRQIDAVGAQVLTPVGGIWLVRLRASWDRAQYPSATSAALKRAARAELLALLAQAAPQAPDIAAPPS